MIDHQATILHNSDSRLGESFRNCIMADAQLHPY